MNKLTQIQNELKVPKANLNKFGNYRYRSAEDIEAALKPLLLKNNCQLFIKDNIKEVCGIPYVESEVTFSDGENTTTVTASAGIDPNMKGMHIAQSFGASSSYARKYALGGLFLLDDVNDPDSQENKPIDLKKAINEAKDLKELTSLYNKHKEISQSAELMALIKGKKEEF